MSRNIVCVDINERDSVAILSSSNRKIRKYVKLSSKSSLNIEDILYLIKKLVKKVSNGIKLDSLALSLPNGFLNSLHAHIERNFEVPSEIGPINIASPDLHVVNDIRYNQSVDGNDFSNIENVKGCSIAVDVHQEVMDSNLYFKIKDTINSLGIKDFRIVNRAHASILGSTYLKDEEKNCLSLNIGFTKSTVSAIVNGYFVDSFTIDFGIMNYLKSIADRFKVSEEASIGLLKGADSLRGNRYIRLEGKLINYDELRSTIESKNRAIVELLLNTRLKSYLNYVDFTVLTGSLVSGFFTELSKSIKVFIGFPTNTNVPEELFSYEYTSCFGLLLSIKREKSMTFAKIFDKIKRSISNYFRFKENI